MLQAVESKALPRTEAERLPLALAYAGRVRDAATGTLAILRLLGHGGALDHLPADPADRADAEAGIAALHMAERSLADALGDESGSTALCFALLDATPAVPNGA
jgi:hypothetical protein